MRVYSAVIGTGGSGSSSLDCGDGLVTYLINTFFGGQRAERTSG